MEKRKIIHIDMDAFYASVEQRDNPELRGVPLVVGRPDGRGVIAAASYEARAFGIYSAMPSQVALRKYPKLHFVAPDFEKYKAVSEKIRKIFLRYTSVIEPLALDEAYLDVTYSRFEVNSATLLAQQIKNDIKNELNLIASAGVSYNKFLAKIASDYDKPDGLFVISPEEGPEFVKELPIEDFFGVGKVTAEKMKSHNIHTGKDILPYAKWELQMMFGKMGTFLYNSARGIDHREVKPERLRKSVGAELTFSENIVDEISINEKFAQVFERWWMRYQHHSRKGKTITLKIRYEDFETITRSISKSTFYTDKEETQSAVYKLLKNTIESGVAIRLLGISISGFEFDESTEVEQLTIW